MKKISILSAIICCAGSLVAQTLFTCGNSQTGKAEFLRAYNKNKPNTTDKEKSMREYLELYTNFKLKVKAAQDIRLDTISQIKYDVQNFRDQVMDNYLNDEKGMELLANEAAVRSTKDIHVLYFSVAVAADAKPEDTMKALNTAKDLYNNLKKMGKEGIEPVVNLASKTYPVKYADVGFITVFSLPYEYENIIYNTKTGDVSQPYRNKKGWVLFKVLEQREAVGKWKAAQLLFAFPPNADEHVKLNIKHKADSVYALLGKGLAFAEAAKLFSDDRMTSLSRGELAEFGTGKYNAVFESNVFALKKDNDYSKPFETSFGYHIVKRITHTAVPTNINEVNYQFEIKQKLSQDARINTEKEKFAKDITVKTGYTRNASVSNEMMYSNADTLMTNPTEERTAALPISKKVIVSFKDGTQLKGIDWLKFVRDYKTTAEAQQTDNKTLFNKFSEKAVLDYYKKHLEEYNSDFKYQMQEFKEGNLLFEIMERNVWSKAGADSIGLRNYYEANKQNYKWGASADVLVFNCANEITAKKAMEDSKNGLSWMSIAEQSKNQIQADSGRNELSQIVDPSKSGTPLMGTYTPITLNTDGTASFIKYIKLYEAGIQRSFEEARGLIINDYQNVLEKQWVESLRKKYTVKVNEAVFKEMLK